jgi:hypothetical protein
MPRQATHSNEHTTQSGGFSDVRRTRRQPVELRVVVQDEDGWEIGLDAANLSSDGVFVQSPILFEPGERHTLIFGSQDGRAAVRVSATVARAERGRGDGMAGMGYRFDDMDEETWASLRKLI